MEADSLRALARVAATSPAHLLDFFLKMPIDLCGAGTSGLSVYDASAPGDPVFRWTNLSGKLEKYAVSAEQLPETSVRAELPLTEILLSFSSVPLAIFIISIK